MGDRRRGPCPNGRTLPGIDRSGPYRLGPGEHRLSLTARVPGGVDLSAGGYRLEVAASIPEVTHQEVSGHGSVERRFTVRSG